MPPSEPTEARHTNAAIRQLPNVLTIIRILLVIPIAALILQMKFVAVLWLALIAGVSDGVDGWVARHFNATTRFGAIADPLADKALMVTTFTCLSIVQLIPWWLTLLVFGRDLLIVGGVIVYRQLTGRIDMEPSNLSKFNTLLQITFALSLIMQQIWPLLPPLWFDTGMVLIAVLAVATGLDYIQTGLRKTHQLSAARDDS